MRSSKAQACQNGKVECSSSSDQERSSSRNCRTSVSSRSNKQSMFEFLKRRKKGIQQPQQAKDNLTESNRTFKSSLQSQEESKRQVSPVKNVAQSHQASVDSERSAGEATTRKTTTARGTREPTVESCSPRTKPQSPCFPSKHRQIVELFRELAEACNTYAQSGMQYRNHAESFMSQALELARRVEDPALKANLIDLRNCWRTVQNLFKDFQMMDASETVNSMRLIVFEELQIDPDIGARKESEAVQTDEDQRIKQYQEQIIQITKRHTKYINDIQEITKQRETQINKLKQELASENDKVESLQKQMQVLTLDCEKYRDKINELQSQELSRTRTQSKRRLPLSQENKENNIVLVDSITYQQKIDMEVTIREAQMQKQQKIPEFPSRRGWENKILIRQLHDSGNELYDYWETLKTVRNALVKQKLYHRVSQHYEAINFNDKLYV